MFGRKVSVSSPLRYCWYRQAKIILGEDRCDAQAQNTEQNRVLLQSRTIVIAQFIMPKFSSVITFFAFSSSEEACIHCLWKKVCMSLYTTALT
jgi:hypothetical protein